MSNLDPQPYDENAIRYISKNASLIDDVGAAISVPPSAIAASISREITRADGEKLAGSVLHRIALFDDRHIVWNSYYKSKFAKDESILNVNPSKFDGEYGKIHQFRNPTLSGIGPGAMKILTAFQIIKQYQDTPQGKTLGLDKYPLTDLKAIVNDLNDRSNPLSIKIAGLVVLNGQKFFSDKSIAGIPWSKLTQEQQDAALTAYYSLGEHAVSVDMSKNEFFPFTTGPKGGKVGPWILFGGDYAKLNAILAKARSVGLPAPPVTRVKAGPKAPAVPKHQASVNGLPVSVRSMIENSPAYANASLRRGMAQPLGEKISRAMAPGGSPAASGPQLGPEYLSQMHKHGGKYTALAHGQPGSLIPELRLAQKHVKSIAHLAAGKASAAPVLSKFLVSRRDALPSIALAGRQTAAKISTEQLISHHSDPALPNGSRHSAPDLQAAQKIDSLKLRGALEELLGQQARLPPSGATAFDPRVSPAWPGLQLPA